MQIITKRIGQVVRSGNSYALNLREELIDIETEPKSQVMITVQKSSKKKYIIIEKL